MYEVKPTCVDFQIKIPNCMYKVKTVQCNTSEVQRNGDVLNGPTPIVNTFDILDGKIQNLIKTPSSMEALQIRQQTALDQLQKLKVWILEIGKELNITQPQPNLFSQNNTSATKMTSSCEKSDSYDIVVNAHPKFVPYGLLALKNAWKNLCNFSVKVFSHSTLPEISSEAKNFQKQISTENDINKNNPTIYITLIWKNCDHTEMISSPTMYKPIYGEINILRFLSRIGPDAYRYDFDQNANHIDAVLDICYQLLRSPEQLGLLKHLSNRLENLKYFGGGKISIADIAVSSSLKRIPQSTLKGLPENVRSWQSAVKNIVLI